MSIPMHAHCQEFQNFPNRVLNVYLQCTNINPQTTQRGPLDPDTSLTNAQEFSPWLGLQQVQPIKK